MVEVKKTGWMGYTMMKPLDKQAMTSLFETGQV